MRSNVIASVSNLRLGIVQNEHEKIVKTHPHFIMMKIVVDFSFSCGMDAMKGVLKVLSTSLVPSFSKRLPCVTSKSVP